MRFIKKFIYSWFNAVPSFAYLLLDEEYNYQKTLNKQLLADGIRNLSDLVAERESHRKTREDYEDLLFRFQLKEETMRHVNEILAKYSD